MVYDKMTPIMVVKWGKIRKDSLNKVKNRTNRKCENLDAKQDVFI